MRVHQYLDLLAVVAVTLLTLGLSIAAVPLLGLLLNWSPWGIRQAPMAVALSLWVVGFAAPFAFVMLGVPALAVALRPPEARPHEGEPVAAGEPRSVAFELLWEVLAARGDVRSVAFSPDGATLATGGSPLQLWDLEDGRSLRRIDLDEHVEGGNGDWANALATHPDGGAIALASSNGTVRVWRVDDGTLLLRIDATAFAGATAPLVPPRDAPPRTVFFADGDANAGAPALVPRVLPAARWNTVWTVAYSPDCSLLASGTDDGVVRLWDAATGQLETSIAAFGSGVAAVAFGPAGTTIAATSRSGSGAVAIWDVATGALVREIAGGFGTAVLGLAFAADGGRLAGADGRLFVWEVAGTEEPAIVQAQRLRANAVAYDPGRPSSVASSADGSRVAAAHAGGVDVLALDPRSWQLPGLA